MTVTPQKGFPFSVDEMKTITNLHKEQAKWMEETMLPQFPIWFWWVSKHLAPRIPILEPFLAKYSGISVDRKRNLENKMGKKGFRSGKPLFELISVDIVLHKRGQLVGHKRYYYNIRCEEIAPLMAL